MAAPLVAIPAALLAVPLAAAEPSSAAAGTLWSEWALHAATLTAAGLGAFAWLRRRRAEDRASRIGTPAGQRLRAPEWVSRSSVAMLVCDETGHIADANDRAAVLYGYPLAELRGLPLGELAARNPADELAAFHKCLNSGAECLRETLHRRKHGGVFDVELTASVLPLQEQRAVLVLCRDISVRKAAEQKMEQKLRLHLAAARIHQALLRADSAEAIQQTVCELLVEAGPFTMAWIGWQDAGSTAVQACAAAGDTTGYLDEIIVSTEDQPEGRGPTGTAIREARTCICNDLLAATAAGPWHEAARRRNFQASIALPLRHSGRTAGALSVYATAPQCFGPDEVALLEPIAAGLSHVLESLARVRTQQQAEARSVLLGAALESAPNGIVITNLHGTIEWANAAFVRASGYTLEELVGKNPRLLKSGHHRSDFYGELWRTILAGEVWHGEMVNRRKTGELFIEELTIIPVRDAAGEVRQFVSITQDVTGRKGAERRIREQAALLDQASDAIVVADLSHRVTFWNRGAERLFGSSARATLGRPLEEAFVLDPDIGSTAFQEALGVPADWRGEIRSRDAAGRVMVIETSITMLRDDHGEPTGRLCISADVTHRKALEEQFLRVQRMENLGMLAAGIAHDLNNILAPMRMVGPLLRDRLVEPRDLRLLDTLESCATRGAGLVRQILGFAQGVAGEHRIVQVKHLLRDISDVIAASFPKSIVLEDEIPTDLWPVNGNPTQIHQVLLNLCVNARDAMPRGGTLRLRGRNCVLDAAAAEAIEGAQPGPWLLLEVEDTGTGIPPEVLPRIWEPLFTTKAPDKGTGLGLSTVRGIVLQHRGCVTVETALNRGTTFRVYLPVEQAAATGAGTPSSVPAVPARGELVMFVDDETSICELATAVLSRHGYRVVTARDGAEAVAQFAPRIAEIALVITDLDMPTLDGAALCRVIHTLSPETKILATSGFVQTAPPQAAFSGFLPKPFTAQKLLRFTEEALRSKPAEAPGSAAHP